MPGVAAVGRLTGVLRAEQTLSGTLLAEGTLEGELAPFSGCSHRIYGGPYDVDPSFDTQTLATKGKAMADNVRVTPIQVERVTNLSGGKTVFIGGIIDA